MKQFMVTRLDLRDIILTLLIQGFVKKTWVEK